MPSWSSSIDSDVGYVPTESEHTDEDWNTNYQDQHYEVVAREFPNLDQLTLQEDVQPVHEQLVHQQSQEVEQVPNLQPSIEQKADSYTVIFRCGYKVEVVVRADGEDIGRRIQLCPFWLEGCNYAEWVDERLCPRSITYANELEREIRLLRNIVHNLQFDRNR